VHPSRFERERGRWPICPSTRPTIYLSGNSFCLPVCRTNYALTAKRPCTDRAWGRSWPCKPTDAIQAYALRAARPSNPVHLIDRNRLADWPDLAGPLSETTLQASFDYEKSRLALWSCSFPTCSVCPMHLPLSFPYARTFVMTGTSAASWARSTFSDLHEAMVVSRRVV